MGVRSAYILYVVFGVMFFFSIGCIIHKENEGFSVKSDVNFSVYNEDASFYETIKNPKLNNKNRSEIINENKRGPFLQSYTQESNNKRFWKTPDNGTCIPSDICNTMFKEIENRDYGIPSAESTMFSNDKRIGNYHFKNEPEKYL